MKTVAGIKHYEDLAEANSEKHALGEMWFVKIPFVSGHNWYVQFQTCRESFRTKEIAEKWAAAITVKW